MKTIIYNSKDTKKYVLAIVKIINNILNLSLKLPNFNMNNI